MVENIYALKNKILQHVEKETQDMQRIDVKEVGELVDMVKDLAEAEEKCWEAAYYRSVTEAMNESHGYTQSMGAPMQQNTARQGYSSSMRSGYSNMAGESIIDKLGEEYKHLSNDEKIMMKSRIMSMFGSM